MLPGQDEVVMRSLSSCRTLPRLPLEAPNFPVNAGVFLGKGLLDSARSAVTVRHHANVGPAEVESTGHAVLKIAGELRSKGVGVHISCQRNRASRNCVPLEVQPYSRSFAMSRENRATALNILQEGALAQRIKALRKGMGLKQAELASLCGVTQVSISQWESLNPERTSVPTSKALIKLSELAPEADRQWWRDLAVGQAGFEGINILEAPRLTSPLRSIPLIKHPKQVATLASFSPAEVERNLQFPSEWFPEGGDIRAVRISRPAMPDLIAMIDVTKRDADRLVGHMVAVETLSGVDVRWLSLDDGMYMLHPFKFGQEIKRVRTHGENSIVGLVRWLGDSIDSPTEKRSR